MDNIIASVCIVAYNEEAVLESTLNDIKRQDYSHRQMEIVLIDSMSSDNTRRIMDNFYRENLHEFWGIQVLENPRKIQAAGWNVAIDHYKGDVIIRIDAHSMIPADFVRKNMELLNNGEYVCGGKRPNIIDGSTPWKETLLLAEQSMFGSSIASYRHSEEKRYVKSLFHGAYRREVFDRVGHFNEQLGRTEDNEIHYRIRQAGYKICYDPQIVSYQHARSTLQGMLKQKYGNGFWIALTLKVCPGCLSVYHFVPLIFVLAVIFSCLMTLLHFTIFITILGISYGAVAVMMALMAVKGTHKHIQYLLLPGIFLLLHLSYGFGSLMGLIKLPFWGYKKTDEEYI